LEEQVSELVGDGWNVEGILTELRYRSQYEFGFWDHHNRGSSGAARCGFCPFHILNGRPGSVVSARGAPGAAMRAQMRYFVETHS
jgi:hypothetical protein